MLLNYINILFKLIIFKFMTNKELIIHLIAQDFKHHLLIDGLHKLGFDDEGTHHLDICTVVQHLMQISEHGQAEQFTEMYQNHLSQVEKFYGKVTDELTTQLAGHCFESLRALRCTEQH